MQFHNSARLVDGKFESGVKLQDLVKSPNPYSNKDPSIIPSMKDNDDLHERSEERKEHHHQSTNQILQSTSNAVAMSPAAHTVTEYRQSFDMDGYINDVKTMDS